MTIKSHKDLCHSTEQGEGATCTEMDDIEDYGGEALPDTGDSGVTVRGVATKQTVYLESQHSRDVDNAEVKAVPGTQKIFVKTYGCSHNISDSEYMEGMLAAYGYRITNQEDADLYLINSCTVKDPSQAAFVNMVNKGKAEGKHVVVAGCVPQGDKSIPTLQDVSQVGITQIDRVVEVVESTLAGEKVQLLKKKKLP